MSNYLSTISSYLSIVSEFIIDIFDYLIDKLFLPQVKIPFTIDDLTKPCLICATRLTFPKCPDSDSEDEMDANHRKRCLKYTRFFKEYKDNIEHLSTLIVGLNIFRRNFTESTIKSFQKTNHRFSLMKDREFRQIIQFLLSAATIHEKFIRAMDKNPSVGELFIPCYKCKIKPNQVQSRVKNSVSSLSSMDLRSEKSKNYVDFFASYTRAQLEWLVKYVHVCRSESDPKAIEVMLNRFRDVGISTSVTLNDAQAIRGFMLDFIELNCNNINQLDDNLSNQADLTSDEEN